mmetsp:Transcript_49273/g.86749  ORF Transcript_49273/g.86749 Transcript_49273/m.86749 type:complete len:360 (-) Transcript_49273:158-1237(-)
MSFRHEPPRCPMSIDKLANSIAPAVHGHMDVKKGILLMLLGGVRKDIAGSVHRGDVHVCLLGDPATAKSTLLKWVASFVPRGVYTSGAGCSAAGLTVAVVADDTGEKVLKPGALMMAAGSVCCIDDFETMQETDQLSIRETMDQQTISVAKAGIQTRLNASSSVLVACSTGGSGDNQLRSVGRSILDAMPAIMLPCFDLFFVVQDEYGGAADEAIARHMLASASSHKSLTKECDRDSRQELSSRDLWCYIQHARMIQPEITREAHCRLTNCYTELRRKTEGSRTVTGGVNARHLQSLIRLSEACARASLDTEVQVEHVDEAFHLMNVASACSQWNLPTADGASSTTRERPFKRARFRGA